MRISSCLYTVIGIALLAGCLALCGCTAQPHLLNTGNATTSIILSTWGNAAEITQLKQQLALFHTQHPSIKVTLRHVPQNYLQKLHILAAAKRLPDVFLINSWHLPMFTRHGLVADLSEFTPVTKLSSQYYPTALQALSFKGKHNPSALGALPRDVSNVVMYVNTSLLGELGIQPPSRDWTIDEFKATASAVCQAQNGVALANKAYGVSFYKQPALFWLPWVWNAGGELLTPTGQWALHQPNSASGLANYLNFHTGDCPIAPTKQQIGQATPTQWFVQQRLAMMVSGRWVTPLLREHAEFKWDVWPMPKKDAHTPSITGVDATGYALSSASMHPQASWQLIQFLTRKEAIEAVAASGLVVPANPTVATSSVFLSPHQPPAHGQVFLDTLPNGHPTPHHPRWGPLEDQIIDALSPYWESSTPVSAATVTQALTPITTDFPEQSTRYEVAHE